MSEWIDVKQELPPIVGKFQDMEYSEKVLCLSEKIGVHVAYYSNYFNGYRTNWEGYKNKVPKVTHWMPLPAPPTES